MMKESVKAAVDELLYSEEQDILALKVESIKDEEILYVLSYNYNWDDGFDVPMAIVHNPYCHLSTALRIFYLADGFSYLITRNMMPMTACKSVLFLQKKFTT